MVARLCGALAQSAQYLDHVVAVRQVRIVDTEPPRHDPDGRGGSIDANVAGVALAIIVASLRSAKTLAAKLLSIAIIAYDFYARAAFAGFAARL